MNLKIVRLFTLHRIVSGLCKTTTPRVEGSPCLHWTLLSAVWLVVSFWHGGWSWRRGMCRWRCTGWSLDDFLASWKYGKLPLVPMEKPFTTWWKKTSLFHKSANSFPTASQSWQFTHIPTTPTAAAIHPFLSNPNEKILWKFLFNGGTICTPVQTTEPC